VRGGGGWGVQTPHRNSEVLIKLSRIPSSMENTSITTYSEYGFHSFANWVEPLTRGLMPSDPRSVCPLFSTEFAEPPRKIPGYTTTWTLHLLYLQNVLQSSGNYWNLVVGFVSLPEGGDLFYMLFINYPTNKSHKSFCVLWSGALGSWNWNFLLYFLAGLYLK
jgi:hypothetical protein